MFYAFTDGFLRDDIRLILEVLFLMIYFTEFVTFLGYRGIYFNEFIDTQTQS